MKPLGRFLFFQNLDSHRCFTPSFLEISLLVSENKIFDGFLPYMGMAAIFVM